MDNLQSLHIRKIRRSYTEDMIINIFWKYGLGKIYRVDFETIVYDETGTWDFEYQNAYLYIAEGHQWDTEVIKSMTEKHHFILYHTNNTGKEECWTMYNNPKPIPKANTMLNIHQLFNDNKILKGIIAELKRENDELKKQLKEYEDKCNNLI